jgi:type IV secretory pathway VirD2 relaxase
MDLDRFHVTDDINYLLYKILENWSRITSFAYKHEVTNEVHNFIIQYDMGKNYSYFVKEIFRYILEEMFKIKLDFTITDNIHV